MNSKELERLKDTYLDLNEAIYKLNEVSANIDNDELFLKLNKITTKVLQAKFELADNVLEPLRREQSEKESK